MKKNIYTKVILNGNSIFFKSYTYIHTHTHTHTHNINEKKNLQNNPRSKHPQLRER